MWYDDNENKTDIESEDEPYIMANKCLKCNKGVKNASYKYCYNCSMEEKAKYTESWVCGKLYKKGFKRCF